MNALKIANIDVDRKMLADLAVKEPETFAKIVVQAKKAIE